MNDKPMRKRIETRGGGRRHIGMRDLARYRRRRDWTWWRMRHRGGTRGWEREREGQEEKEVEWRVEGEFASG